MRFHAYSAARLAREPLPGRCALLRMADDKGLLVSPRDPDNVSLIHSLVFADAEEDYGGVIGPPRSAAKSILEFVEFAEEMGIENFVAQCQAGVGRSPAVCAALSRIRGDDYRTPPTYNRKLYRDILTEAGVDAPDEPLVSIAVRVKYRSERLMGFLLSLQAQRYDNWECIAFTDGPNQDARRVTTSFSDERIRLIETPTCKGRWGHPYRQMAFEACQGEWIGTQNDDNYLTPGFLEQLVTAGEESESDLVVCQSLHRYFGWDVNLPGGDLATWICRRSLLSQYRWTGDGFTADAEFLDTLRFGAGQRIAVVNRPLVVKN